MTMPQPRYPDVKTLTPLETQHITAECRDNRGRYPAWDEAVHRLLHVYEAQVHYRPGATVSIAIYVTNPPSEAETPTSKPDGLHLDASTVARVESMPTASLPYRLHQTRSIE